MLAVAKKKFAALAEKLRAARRGAEKTLAASGAAAGVHPQTYMRWERGETEPTFTQLCALAELFGKTPNDFVTEEEP